MSETTSTNISVAQANSTDSIQVSSTQHSRMTDPGFAKKICFYKSGDPRFSGIKMVVSNRSFKTFDALLDSLSKKVPLPFGVRNITTPRGIHHITTLEELEDGKAYICSHQRKIKPINLERASKKPLLWQSSRPISARRRVMQLARQNEVVPFQKENTVVLGSSKNFVIFKNGDKECRQNLVLNKKSIQNFDAFLDQISELLQFPVYKLYSTDGRRILSTHALLLSSGTVVAAGREPFKPGNYESEREFLPAKLPGISHRVFPKPRSKSEMKSQVKPHESVFTSPNSQEHLHESVNVCTVDNNIIDFAQVPNDELHMTQQWPQCGEELPVISPGDNIEKTVHLNSDGTMTVEMKVRFKIREEETINWSTTVSRAELCLKKNKIFCSSVNPEDQTINVIDSPIGATSMNCKCIDEDINAMAIKQHSHIEQLSKQIQDNDININKYETSSVRTEKSTFYRPPTPGIRKGQERRLSIRRASEVTLQETRKQMFCFNEMDNETTKYGNDAEDQCSRQEQALTGHEDSKASETSLMQNEIEQTNEDNFGMLETTHMELLQKNTIYEKGVRKSESSNYMSFRETSKTDRPYSAGRQKLQQEQFKFKEIKRSVSASVTVSEQSILEEEVKNANMKFDHGNCLDVITQENEIAQMVDAPSERFSGDDHSATDYTSAISGKKIEKVSENDTGISNDNQSTTSSLGAKKKKKKNLNNPKKDAQAKIPKDDKICLNSSQVEHETSCGEANPTAKNIMFEEIFPPQLHPLPNGSELGTTRKLKGNKQMAKVKPRSLKANDEFIHNNNQNTEDREDKKCNVVGLICKEDIADHGSTITSNEELLYNNDQTQCSLTENKSVPEEVMPRKNSKSKRSQKTSKKPKSPKKKKSRTEMENKVTNGSDGLDSQNNNSPALQNALESYVQGWLKNIFPNVAFPVLQPFLSTRLEEDTTNSITNSSNGSCTESYVEISNLIRGSEICGNANGCQNKTGSEENQVRYADTREKEIPIQQVQPFDEDFVSSFMEKSKHLTELFAQQFNNFGCNTFTECNKGEEVSMGAAGHGLGQDAPKKLSIDAAVQVENNNSNYSKCGFIEEMLAEQFGMSPQNMSVPKCRRLEKSFSLPNSPYRRESSSPQILLAWLIVLQLKQSISKIVENVPNESNNTPAVLTVLQFLKKLAIVEKADDLKAVVQNLQETALKSNSPMKNVPCVREPTLIDQFPKNSTEGTTECIMESNHNIPSIKETSATSNVLKSEVLIDDMDDFNFFAAQPYRMLSGDCSQNENDRTLEEHSLSEYPLQNTAERVEKIQNDKQKEYPLDQSPRHSPSLTSEYNVDHTVGANPVSPQKTSRVKLMVQEMEQRRYSSQCCEQQKCLQSPISSDSSDYRQDSEESPSDTLRASSEIMTESGEEQIHEKPFKTGHVKRAIERLYGKAESKIQPCTGPTTMSSSNKSQCKNSPNNENNEYLTFSSQKQQCLSKENISSVSLPLLDADGDHDGTSCKKPGLSKSNKLHKGDHMETCSHKDTSTKNGVLIDKGRWLLKENHLIRRSPPEATGMYVNLDTTSGDTLLDNTSDEVPYMHSACKMNQPLTEISSSEIEDLTKPHHYTCNYFNMPHGSDSEHFNDTLSTKSKVRSKSFGAVVKSQPHDSGSLRSVDKCGGISESLPSFATVDFHMSDNKVHPLPHPDKNREEKSPNTDSGNRGQITEQDSLDKLHFICGQHCPILNAIILPVNEGNRGFAYCSPSDIENLL
ncbi:hypothetical protein GDO78_012458, partial [Eleutherodactylus coqui]